MKIKRIANTISWLVIFAFTAGLVVASGIGIKAIYLGVIEPVMDACLTWCVLHPILSSAVLSIVFVAIFTIDALGDFDDED